MTGKRRNEEDGRGKVEKWRVRGRNIVINILEPIVYVILLVLCTAFLVDASFNPFLYFRF